MSAPTPGRELLVLVYDELRALARSRLGHHRAPSTLQPTALVHEAFLRLSKNNNHWNSKGHFFGAAAEAMRQILVEQARRKSRLKRGGDRQRVDLSPDEPEIPVSLSPEILLAIDEAISVLEADDPDLATIVKLRFFSGLTPEETAAVMGVSRRTIERRWRYAAAWLRAQLDDDHTSDFLNASQAL